MFIVGKTLLQMPRLCKPQFNFMSDFLQTFEVLPGRANLLNISRFSNDSERTMARWARRPFSFSDYNLRLVDEFVPAEHEKVLVLDTTTIDKSGKHTYGLGYFYDSSENRSKRCLEACVLGIVDQSEKTAYVIAAELTPPEITKDTEGAETRVDFYAQMLQRNCKDLKHSLLLADGEQNSSLSLR